MNRRGFIGLFATVALAALLGCASAPISRIDEFRDVYETWPLEARQMVLNGQVIPGMTVDMVYLAWGSPTHITVSPMVSEEVWHYEDEGLIETGRRGAVVFRAGQVVSVDIRR